MKENLSPTKTSMLLHGWSCYDDWKKWHIVWMPKGMRNQILLVT